MVKTFRGNLLDIISADLLDTVVPPCAVVKLLNKRWWIAIGARPEGLKLEPEGPRAKVGFPTADQGFSSIQGTLFGFYGI